MTNEELIKALRAWDGSPFDDDAHEAADRVEQLQAKLAKAVAALRYVVSAKGLTDPTECGYEAIKHARIALAEIKGETK